MGPRISILAFAAGLLLASCGGGPVTRDIATVAAVPQEYRIGPGDQLNIFVFSHPELSGPVPVRPDGMISSSLAENIPAAGRTPSALSRDLETVLGEYVRAPKVNVIVTSFVGGDQVRVVGQAARPTSLPFRASMTLLDVMIQAGGLAEFAAGNRARLVRRVDGKETEIPVRLRDLLNKGDMRANMAMMPGDVLIIPESRF